jgi:hypothetical protein
VVYTSGQVVNTMRAAYTGEDKTDAKDAYVIAEAPSAGLHRSPIHP